MYQNNFSVTLFNQNVDNSIDYSEYNSLTIKATGTTVYDQDGIESIGQSIPGLDVSPSVWGSPYVDQAAIGISAGWAELGMSAMVDVGSSVPMGDGAWYNPDKYGYIDSYGETYYDGKGNSSGWYKAAYDGNQYHEYSVHVDPTVRAIDLTLPDDNTAPMVVPTKFLEQWANAFPGEDPVDIPLNLPDNFEIPTDIPYIPYAGDVPSFGTNFDLGAAADPHCFESSTRIQLAAGGLVPIGSLSVGDYVLAFDGVSYNGRGSLLVGRVVRLFTNITTEWLNLPDGLTVTPGHLFLNELGQFERIDAIIARGGKIVTAAGALEPVTAERIVYSEETRHLYEEAEEIVYATEGGAALAPQVRRGWRTYNFEVDGLHTYIAGGYRVHNDSDASMSGW